MNKFEKLGILLPFRSLAVRTVVSAEGPRRVEPATLKPNEVDHGAHPSRVSLEMDNSFVTRTVSIESHSI